VRFLSRLRAPEQDPAPPPDSGPEAGAGSLEDIRFQLQVESVLNDVRPALQADGGDIELVEIVGKSVKVRMVGACHGCASASFTLRLGIEKRLREEIPEFGDLIPV